MDDHHSVNDVRENSSRTAVSRPRVSAAVLSVDTGLVLMVQHRRSDGTTYWQLPGGGVMAGEAPEAAVVRELREETGLEGRVVRKLFTIPYKYGASTTFLVIVEPTAVPVLGFDPEEVGSAYQKLIAVAWQSLHTMHTNPEIAALMEHLPIHFCTTQTAEEH